jgi:Glyoxalase/Bleomycin resistance protein/Dioxygenase superfamily
MSEHHRGNLDQVPVDQLYRIGVVVKNLEAAARNYAEVYGIDRWKVSQFDGRRLSDTVVEGRSVEHAYRTATGSTPSGAITFELIEPGKGESTYSVFRATHGHGVQNLVLHVAAPDQAHVVRDYFASEGIAVAQSGTIDGDVSYLEFDTRQTLGGYNIKVLVAADGPDLRADEEWDLSDTYTRPPGRSFIDVPQLGHFGIVVRDVLVKVARYAELFGIRQWPMMNWRAEHGRLDNPFYRGESVNHEYFCGLAFGFHNFGFELIQPTLGPSDYKDFLSVVGEGVHHLMACYPKDNEEWADITAWMESMGVPVVMGSSLLAGRADFYYLDTREKLSGYVLEAVVIHRPLDPAASPIWDYVIDFDAVT